MDNEQIARPQPLLLDIGQTGCVLSVGKSKIYELMACEGLPYIKLGKSLRFPYHALRQWVEDHIESATA